MSLWAEENFKGIVNLRIPAEKCLFATQSDFQKVEVFATASHGRVLLLDGCMMISERDEFIYHEMMAHVPLFVHPKPHKVLVIGGGDGGTAREVIKHKNVSQCTVVEIDGAVVSACKEFIPNTAQSFDDPKVNLIIADAVRYVAETKERFDVILVDSTDPVGPAAPLFGPAFYKSLRRCLSEDGVVIAQAESPFYEPEAQASVRRSASSAFSQVQFYNFTNMTYPGGLWSFLFASNSKISPDSPQAHQFNGQVPFLTKYYTFDVHRAAFALPRFMQTQGDHERSS